LPVTNNRYYQRLCFGAYCAWVKITVQLLAKFPPNSLKFEVYPLFLDDSHHGRETDQSIGRPPVKLLVSIATVPTLIAIVGLQAMLQQAQALANNSAEIFRGDRLPLLPFPEPSPPPSSKTLN
jgi:hypothetical protein